MTYGSWTRLLAGAALLAFGAGCKDSTAPPGGNNQTPSIGVSISVQSLSIAQGAAGTVGVTVSRAGGYAGDVGITVENLPGGVTWGPSPTTIAPTATSATLTLNAAAGATAGTSTVTVRASGSGVDAKTVTFSLTVTAVTPQGSFALSLNPASLSVQQGGGNAAATVNIARTGSFTGTVALSVTGAPPGLVTAFNPAAVSGNSAALTISAPLATAAGSYTLTIRGTGNGVADQTVTLALTVTAAPPSGNFTWTFCAASGVPNWVAYQDGAGAWTKATAAGNTFGFNIQSGKGGVALVTVNGTDIDVRVIFGTTAELTAYGQSQCQGSGLLETYTGTVAGAAATDQAWISAGAASAIVLPAVNPTFALTNVPDGQVDLLAALITQSFVGGIPTYTLNRVILRRSQNPANNAALPAFDFSTAEAVAPLVKAVSLTNLGTDVALTMMSYHTATGTSAPFFTDLNPSTATSRQFPGMPAAQQADGDLHLLTVLAVPPGQQVPSETRSTTLMFREAVDKALPLGPSLGALTVGAAATTPFVMPRVQMTIQPEYDKYFVAAWQQSANGLDRSVTVSASAAYLGSTTALDLSMPDLSPVPDWSATWGFVTRTPITLQFSASGWDVTGGFAGSPFAEGGSSRSATRRGELRT